MPINLEDVVDRYLRAKKLSGGTRSEYYTTIKKWTQWGASVPIEQLGRQKVRDFLDWVYEQAVTQEGANPGRTANKARENLRAIMAWAWEQDMIDTLPRFPKSRQQRDVAGRHYLAKAEINALYFGTHKMKRPRGWNFPFSVGQYWRCALVIFFNYGVDTGTVWKSTRFHEPMLWRHVSWETASPNRQVKERCRWGWIFYRRVKTGKAFYRPMNKTVHAHIRSIMPNNLARTIRCSSAEARAPTCVSANSAIWPASNPRRMSKQEKRKHGCSRTFERLARPTTTSTFPNPRSRFLDMQFEGVTYRHYADRAPLAFKAIMTIPQPSAFGALVRGFNGECPCCRRPFVEGT